MNLDFLQLKDFDLFYKTELGTKVKETIVKKIYRLWPELNDNKDISTNSNNLNKKKQKILGIGYTAPYLELVKSDEFNNISIISGEMVLNEDISNGFNKEPNTEGGEVISNLYNLPLKDASIDKIIILHSLEFSNNQSKFLREIWRVMKDNGKVIFIVPNRLSIWSKIHKTPFGHGHPYSPQQLEKLLSNSLFTLTNMDIDIFVPPVHVTLLNRIVIMLHYLCSKISSMVGGFIFGGVIIAEARKEIYGMTPTGGEKVTFGEKISVKNIHK